MKEENSEAIVLRSFDYQEKARILTLFTKEAGLLQLIVKGLHPKNLPLFALTTVFCVGHYHFMRGRSDLFRYLDGSCLELLPLQSRLVHLQAAAAIAQALLHSQMAGKPSPKLYALTLAYLRQIPHMDDPAPLVASYTLKLLKHDGLTHLREGLPHRDFFTKTEWTLLQELQDARQFKQLKRAALEPHLQEKLKSYFLNRIRQI